MPPTPSHPSLTVRGADAPDAVVLVLHGGRANSVAPVRAGNLAMLRLVPFADVIARRGGDRVAVARLRFGVRGWNAGREPAPVRDAEWALAELRGRFPGRPIGLVGHSMGGRTALRVADAPDVGPLVGLAPWLPPGEPLARLGGPALFVHGTADRVTSLAATESYAARLRIAGADVEVVPVPGGGHSMLRPASTWHELAARFVLTRLLPDLDTSGWPAAPKHLAEVLRRRRSLIG